MGPCDAAIPEDRTLELDATEMERLTARALDRIVHHITTLADQPAGYHHPPAAPATVLAGPIAETATPLDELLDQFFDRALPVSFNTAGPGYLAYIPGGGLFTSAVADFIAAATNRYVGVWAAAPLLVAIENQVLRWLAELMGLGAEARGILTSGGSMANLTGIVTARSERLGEDLTGARLYVGDQAHHSVAKAAVLAGLPRHAVVVIGSDDNFRIRLDALETAVATDRAAGRRPFLVVASAGTTNTGAVDDLTSLAELCAHHGLWLHVDAAYGGFFRLTAHGRAALAGIESADSIVLDPHKGLFVPYGTGALLVRDGPALRRAHAVHADYMPPMQDGDDGDRVDFCEHGPELSRSFRGLRVWLPLKLHGLAPFRTNLEEKLALARYAAERLRQLDGIELVAEPQLSTLAFRLVRPGLDGPHLDELNRRLLQRLLAANRVWLTATTLKQRFVIRICVLHFRTHKDRIDECLSLIRQAMTER